MTGAHGDEGSVVGRGAGGTWHPSAAAMGPFGGLHGGVVSGVLAGELEARAREAGWGQPMSATVYLVRPAPREAFETRVETVRAGQRLTVAENSLIAGGKLRAKASMAFLSDVPVPGLSPAPDRPADPDALPVWGFASAITGTTYLSAVDVREDRAHACIWARPRRPLLDRSTPFAQAMAIADFASLFTTYLAGARPKAGGWPNADISLSLSRLPEGDWIGVRPRSSWHPNGAGLTEAEILDARGWIGRSTQSIALLPAGAGPMG